MMKAMLRSLAAMVAATGFALAGEATWLDNYETAVEQAKKEDKPILVDFTGSDWCGWCVRLHKEVFSQKAFQEYAEKHLVLLELDFPKKKKLSEELTKQNKDLAKKYEVRGYPTILLIDAEGEVLGRTGYKEGGPEAYVAHLKQLLERADML